MSSSGWIGVDLDGTLAEYHGWRPDGSIGDPIPLMVDRVRQWMREGVEVRIFTARIWPLRIVMPRDDMRQFSGANTIESEAGKQAMLIQEWSLNHLGRTLPITTQKDYQMIELWDDRAVGVICNTGKVKA